MGFPSPQHLGHLPPHRRRPLADEAGHHVKLLLDVGSACSEVPGSTTRVGWDLNCAQSAVGRRYGPVIPRRRAATPCTRRAAVDCTCGTPIWGKDQLILFVAPPSSFSTWLCCETCSVAPNRVSPASCAVRWGRRRYLGTKEDEGARAIDLTSGRFRLERRVTLRRIRSAPLIFDRTV
jgi:hypothetical protein